ncbi:MAG: hypothetical protein AAGH40_09115, partial [Verrucomicrobiota bacterium]
VNSANFNSRDHQSDYFEDTSYWRPISQIEKGSYLKLSYAEPHLFKSIGGDISAKEVWVDLADTVRANGGAVYPGPITLKNGDERVLITKEGGHLLLSLGLDPALYPHLPEVVQDSLNTSRDFYENP